MGKNIIIGAAVVLLVLFVLAFIFARIELKRVSSAFALYTRETERRVDRLETNAAGQRAITGQLRRELDSERESNRKQRKINQRLREEDKRDRERIERAEKLNDSARDILKQLINKK